MSPHTESQFLFQRSLTRKKWINLSKFTFCVLTAGSFTVVTEVTLLWLHSDARLIPHGVDLGHAEFGVLSEEETSSPNSQVVLTPVPQKLQVLVVDGGERIHADDGRRSRGGYNHLIQRCEQNVFFIAREHVSWELKLLLLWLKRAYFCHLVAALSTNRGGCHVSSGLCVCLTASVGLAETGTASC